MITVTAILVMLLILTAVLIRVPLRRRPAIAARTRAEPSVSHPLTRNVEGALSHLASLAQPSASGRLTAVVQVHVTDQIPSDWYFAFGGGTCSLVQGHAERPQLVLGASASTWIELAEKRISFAGAMMRGSLKSEGDIGILMRLDGEFSGLRDSSPHLLPNAAGGPSGDAGGKTGGAANDSGVPGLRSGGDNRGPASALNMLSVGSPRAEEIRAAALQALRDLPPGASDAEKVAAVQAALHALPDSDRLVAKIKIRAAAASRQTGG